MAKKETPAPAAKRRVAKLFTVLVLGGAMLTTAACGPTTGSTTGDGGVPGGGDGGGSHGW
jgi:hypothetical protein